jgi:hypothetical protein
MLKLKKEERNLVLEIISFEKKLGLDVELKKPMIKTGFFIPKKLEIKPIKKEDEEKEESDEISSDKEIKLKSKNNKNEIILPHPLPKTTKKKVTRKMIRRNINRLKIKTRDKLQKTNKRIDNILENAVSNNTELTSQEKDILKNIKQENKKAKNEIDEWLQFILSHTKELIASYEQKNKMNITKLKEIEPKFLSL